MACYPQSLPQWGRFEIGSLCNRCNIPVDCGMAFAADGSVTAFGGITRGSLNADVDVTGLGITFAFFFPNAISLVVSSLLIVSLALGRKKPKKGGMRPFLPRPGPPIRTRKHASFSERVYDFLESLLRSVSDIQILLALALAISFVSGICNQLQYHLDIGVNLLLLVCANYLLTLGLVRHYWRSWSAGIAALIRLMAVVGIYFFLGWLLALQNAPPFLDSHPFIAEHYPGEARNDSVILLKAACFLDPQFQTNVFEPLGATERERIGLNDNTGWAPEWVLLVLLATMTSLVLLFRLLSSFGRFFRRQFVDEPPPANLVRKRAFHFFYWCFIWLLYFVVFCYSATTVRNLCTWASQSGWLQPEDVGKPENDQSGFGQILALVLMATVLIAALEYISLNGTQRSKAKGNREVKMKKGKPLRQVV